MMECNGKGSDSPQGIKMMESSCPYDDVVVSHRENSINISFSISAKAM